MIGGEREEFPTTLFIDNLPTDIRKIWMYNLFSKSGKVIDSYLPVKRSKISGNRFGFVRFAHKKEAMVAIVRTNGLWVWNQSLVENTARFMSKQSPTRYGNGQGKITRSTDFKQSQVQNYSGFEKENIRYGNMQCQTTRSSGFKLGQVQKYFGFEKGFGSHGNM